MFFLAIAIDRGWIGVEARVILAFVGATALLAVGLFRYELRVPTARLRLSSASLLLANAGFAAGFGWYLVDDRGSSSGATAWVLCLSVAHVAHVALGGLGFRQRMSREVAGLIVAVGVGLSGVGLALALDGPALVAGWCAEAVVLAWLAQRAGEERALVLVLAFVAVGLLLLSAAYAYQRVRASGGRT